ncbi:Ig-like domain-containing protein [Companilactobacillus sp. HBUAS59699]|uniref:Ig-like domain-containing protein n=1 Tax=Companilactobacillus sp. HBUAS59699 TaxID=3109358 RepID=UPI002FF20938
MILDITLLVAGLMVIAGIIYLIRKTWQERRQDKTHLNIMFLLSIVVAIFFIPASIGMIGGAIYDLSHPTPALAVTNKHVKITGTNTKGTLKGTTKPNLKVKLKESDGIDHVKRTVTSDSKGKFEFRNLDSNSDFKLNAINGSNKSKTIHISVGDIPDSAYTKLSIDHSDDIGDIKVKQNENTEATITGTASKNATIELDDSNYEKIRSIHVDNNGKWSLTLKGTDTKKKITYSVVARHRGLQESDSYDITVTNPNYTVPVKKAPTQGHDNENNKSDSQATSDSNTPTKANDQKLDKQTFVADMKAYLNNQYPDVSFKYSRGMASFTVPNEISALNKREKKAYVDPLYDRMITFLSNENMNTVPTILVETQDGTPIARSAVFSSSGYKIYK